MVHTTTATVTTSGTRVPLALSSTTAIWLTIIADLTITGTVFVGDVLTSSVVGYPLLAGDVLTLPPNSNGIAYNLSQIYIDADHNGSFVRVIYQSKT